MLATVLFFSHCTDDSIYLCRDVSPVELITMWAVYRYADLQEDLGASPRLDVKGRCSYDFG